MFLSKQKLNYFCIFRKLKPAKLSSHSLLMNYPKYLFSYRDEKFWEEYSKRKEQGGRYPALGGQEIIFNKVIHSWKHSDKHAINSEEFLSCLRDLNSKDICPFVILDVREESEYELFKLPYKTQTGVEIPILYRTMNEINHGNFNDVPIGKYVVCIDSLGLRGRQAARNLNIEGYLTLYVEGGYDLFISLIKSRNIDI